MGRTFRSLAILAAALSAISPALAADDGKRTGGLLDGVLEMLDLKATPAAPPPEFVRKTRPDASGLDFMRSPLPHAVSPRKVKTPGEVEAAKDALDLARTRQLAPSPPAPKEIIKGSGKIQPQG